MGQNKPLAYAMLLVLALIWGSSFILMKRGLESFSAAQVAALRLGIASLSLLPIALRHLRLIGTYWKPLLVVGFIGSGVPAILFTTSELHISSSLAGALNSLTPLFTLLVGTFLFKRKIKLLRAIGVVVGLLGAWVLMAAEGDFTIGGFGWAMLPVVACFCYGISVNTIKRYFQEVPSPVATSLNLLLIGIPCLAFAAVDGVPQMLVSQPHALISFGYISILAVVGTSGALLIYTRLVQITSPVIASSVTYLMPLVAIAWGIMDAEPLNWKHAAGLFLVLVGVWAVNKEQK